MTFVIARGLNIFIQFASIVLLARLLSPQEVGLAAMVLSLTGFAPFLIDFGTSEACTQRTHITPSQISSLFWLNIAIGVGLTILLVATSGLIADFFGEPSLAGVAVVSSITFLATAASVQHYALMRRAMDFRRIALIDIATNVIGSSVSVALAALGFGYWALVAKPIVTSTLSSLGAWASCRWIPGRPEIGDETKEMIGFGMRVTGFTVADYVARSADRVAIGYFQGPGPLGFFQNAFSIYGNLLNVLTDPLHNVVVATLSKLRSDLKELKRLWTTALSSLSFVSAPAFAALAASGQDIVVVVLGEKWSPAGPLLCMFAIRGIAHTIERTSGWLHVAAGRPDRWMRWGIVAAMVQLAALAVGMPFGLQGVALTYAVAMFALAIPALAYAGRPLGISAADVLRVVGPQTVSALAAFGISYWIQMEYLADLAPISRILVVNTACLAIYLALATGVFRITHPLQTARMLFGNTGARPAAALAGRPVRLDEHD